MGNATLEVSQRHLEGAVKNSKKSVTDEVISLRSD